jgi:hypothetical protein
MLRSGKQVQGRRACEGLERGGGSPEGVTNPRAKRNLTRGGDRPSSEVEPHPRGRPTLERGGVSLVRRCDPRAKRSFTRGQLGPTALVGRGPLPLGHDRFECILGLWIHLSLFFTKVNGFPSGF